MAKATYYIEVDTYWERSPSYFVGPFDSRAIAEAWGAQPGDNVWRSDSRCGGDIRDAWRVYPNALSATQARRERTLNTGDNDNTISPTTALRANALSAAVRELREVWS